MPFRYQPQAKVDRIMRKAWEAARASTDPLRAPSVLSRERHEVPTPGEWAITVWFDHQYHSPADAPPVSILCDGYFEDASAVYETLVHYLSSEQYDALLDLEDQGLAMADAIAWARAQLIHSTHSTQSPQPTH